MDGGAFAQNAVHEILGLLYCETAEGSLLEKSRNEDVFDMALVFEVFRRNQVGASVRLLQAKRCSVIPDNPRVLSRGDVFDAFADNRQERSGIEVRFRALVAFQGIAAFGLHHEAFPLLRPFGVEQAGIQRDARVAVFE